MHVWRIALDFTPSGLDVLSQEEQQRALRMKHEGARNCFIRSHFAVRHILSKYLGQRPEDITFRVQPRGKPEVNGIKFSLSHTEGQALLGITLLRNIGIDIERMRPIERLNDLVERFLSKDEKLDVFDAEDSLERFFKIWTAKEALAKATGIGLAGLDSAAPGLLVKPLIMPAGYVGAVAIEGSDMNWKYFDWVSAC